jgi:carbamoyl-phosphate synthase / aspartate carbamoyltransferase
LADTLRTLGCYCDAIVLRHPDPSSADIAAEYSPVPVINGGNGSVEHPTQAMLDLFTLREELGTVNGLQICFVGDLKYGRTVHSLIKLLDLYDDVTIALVAPRGLELPDDLRQQLIRRGRLIKEAHTLEESIISSSDAFYVTRIQAERLENPQEYKETIRIDNKVLGKAKNTAIVVSSSDKRPA